MIDTPLVESEDFNRVQQIMDLKKKRHWRTRSDYEHRFTYNNFLVCGECGSVIYTHFRGRDYYICSGRKKRGCGTRYLRKEVIELQLDELFSTKLTDPPFLEEIAAEWRRLAVDAGSSRSKDRLQTQMVQLGSKRERVIDLFVEGIITADDRNQKLATIEHDLHLCTEELGRITPNPGCSVQQLASFFEPFFDFQNLSREQKRIMLGAIVPKFG